ncbi:hypothetical protein O7620_02330 [Micromonospora sp. WMMD710]|nr:hypothetical protein [Micromonospora sp. WMMD710]MDG4756732.1 hypothetical protein [Micromonospora sp. WMMD710]
MPANLMITPREGLGNGVVGSGGTPRLLGCVDDGEWVALVFSDVEGRHPATPWRADELNRVRNALEVMAWALTGVYAGLAGFFADSARRPPPQGIPTVRAFQQAQADALLPWLAQRLA